MTDTQTPDTPTKEALLEENRQLRARMEELEETLHAIRSGEVDALVVSGPEGEQVYSLRGALDPYRVMVEAMSEGAVTFNTAGSILYCNTRFAELLKIPLEQAIGSTIQNFVEPHERRGFDALLEEIKRAPLRRTIRFMAADGTMVLALFSARTLKNDRLGDIAAVIADLSEVTAAAEARSRLALIVDSTDDAIISTSLDGVVQSWNAAAVRMFDYSAEEAIGQPVQFLIVPSERAGEIAQKLAAIRQGERMRRIETGCMRKDGTRIEVSATVSPINDATGRVLGMSLILHDITELKRAEQELSASEQKFTRFFMQAPIPMAVISNDGSIVLANDQFTKVLGYTTDDIPTLKEWWQLAYPDASYRQELMDSWGVAVAVAARERTTVEPLECRVSCKNGAERTVLISGIIVEDKVLATFIDFTERKRAEEELHKYQEHLEALVRERTAKLEAAYKDLESFAYSVSHDLRTPLRAIDGFSQLVMKHYADKLDDEGKRYLTVVCDNTKKMGQLIEDILTFSRIGRAEKSESDVSMEELAREVFEELKQGVAGRELAMVIKPLPPCRGDHAMLRQVWVNLLNNAIKFTRLKPAANIEVGGSTEGAEQVYYVKDNGAGFDMQYAGKLFGVFQRLHGNEEFEGTGIGLAIVKRIVTRHGGRVWAEGKVNEGATFHFALPKAAPSGDASPHVESGK